MCRTDGEINLRRPLGVQAGAFTTGDCELKQAALLDGLVRRVPFTVARRLLIDSGFPSGHGWDAVMEKLKDKSVAAKTNTAALSSLYVQALAATQKRVSIYKVSRKSLSAIDAGLTGNHAANSNNAIVSAYPLPLTDAQIQIVKANDPVVAGMVAWPRGRLFVLSYVKEVRERIAIAPSQISGLVGSPLKEAYGIRIQRVQVFDALIVSNHDDRLIMLTDILDSHSQESVRDSVSRVTRFLEKSTRVSLKGTRINLFSAISPFYQDPDVNVISIDHLTPDGRAVTEKVKGDQVCVREGDFHKGGMAASGTTDAFGITVAWKIPTVGNATAYVELSIDGPTSLAHALNPNIEFATLTKAATTQELAIALRSLNDKV